MHTDAMMLSLIIANHLDLLRTRALGIKRIPHPLLRQPPRQLYPHNPLPHTEHLRIVAHHRPLDAETIVRRHGPDARYFVRGDGHAEPGAADQQGAVGFAGEDELGGVDGDVRVRGFVFVVDHAHVNHF